ncbi:phytoene/squalene synthase family protein [Alkalihalobacillus sp. LMS39]|uniref:squalene/phytoene synthase family protein n=1 Tax=Alkalihalobacillus sp. LMS39 TaxID=2924032 RepID=UPI001FB2690C|nr:phytoene/squalene synthase family protein [Alkalihalobacillus sp. LMS39]UOE92004.1 phytoene/squalene synthase family protein [Alkalihalobacillus sp. LMS39]
MKEKVKLQKTAKEMLKATSRTFYIPISALPNELKEAVTSAYLCMRAIDEIEDHPQFPAEQKIKLLRNISELLENPTVELEQQLTNQFEPYTHILPSVTLQLYDWIVVCPQEVQPNVLHYTAVMAKGMADWVEKGFEVTNEQDLDDYTYYVAGLVGELLSELWAWYDNVETDQELAVAFGRGLQAVNIIRNRDEDLERDGVDFFPEGWDRKEMFNYARKNLALGLRYMENLKPGPIYNFCKIPHALAQGTLEAIEKGREKLSRTEVVKIVGRVAKEQIL